MSTAHTDFSLFGGAEVQPPSLRPASVSSDEEDESISEDAAPFAQAGEQWAPRKVTQDPNDFLWQMTEEPHRSRRRAILKAHPEVSPSLLLRARGGLGGAAESASTRYTRRSATERPRSPNPV